MGIFARIKKAWYDSIIWETIDEDFYDELEESLIMADLGASVAADAVKELRKVVYEKSIQRGDDVKQALRDILEKKLEVGDTSLDLSTTPSVVLIIGVNGVGKTTSIGKLASRYKKQGKRVLLIDCDGQCNLTNFYKPGYDPDSDSNVATLLLGMAEPLWSDSAITLSPSMLLVPASSELYDIDCNALHEGMRRTRVLYDFVRAAEDDNGADYCILDCPPGYTVASVNALFACDEVIVPAKIDGFVFDGLESVRAQIRSLRRARPDVRIAGVLVTMRNSSEVVREGETLLRQRGIPVFEQVIRRTDKVVETTFEKKPLIDYCPRSVATQDYRRWVAEYLGEELGHGEV